MGPTLVLLVADGTPERSSASWAAMKLTERLRYDAPPDAVWAMITDQDFREEVCRATGAKSWDVVIAADAGGGTVSVTRVLPTPSQVTGLVGDTATIVQAERWGATDDGGTRRADVRLEVEGQPATLTGTHTLSPSGAGTALDVVGDLGVRIPLLGARLEKELAEALTTALAKEHEVGCRWLS